MKAIVYEEYGPPDVLKIKEVDKPNPKKNEVLIRVRGSSIAIGDSIMRSFNIPVKGFAKFFARLYLGFNKPKRTILGMELAGVIEEVGRDVKNFKKGDEVYGSTFWADFGGHGQYKCLKAKDRHLHLALKPENMTYEEAAPVTGGCITALGILRKADIKEGQKVLIYGASGSVGTYAVQLAKFFGAKVTGICSTANLEMVQSIGADKVIDYTQEDFADNGEIYDVIFDAVSKYPTAKAKKSLKKGGIYFDIFKTDPKIKVDDLTYLKEIIEAGKLKTVIDRSYSFEDIPEAHRYVDKGHKKGNVVITID